MKTIYKYAIPNTSLLELNLTKGAIVRHFGEQNNILMIWVELWPHGLEREVRKFVIKGTGWDIEDDLKYIATVVCTSGYVWHLYEVIP